MFDLTGKVAIVTGASRGIGRAISEALGRQGALVAMTDVLGDAAVQAAHELVAGGLKAEGYTMDVTSAEDVQATVASIVERHNRVDILVNNAGIVRDMVALRLKREDWDLVLKVNLTGTFTCTQAVLRTMMRQHGGRIISISSVVGQMGNAGQANYAASKAGLIGFSMALAREVASRNITVNVVAPGLIDSHYRGEIKVIAVNLDHYRLDADYKHGIHYTARRILGRVSAGYFAAAGTQGRRCYRRIHHYWLGPDFFRIDR